MQFSTSSLPVELALELLHLRAKLPDLEFRWQDETAGYGYEDYASASAALLVGYGFDIFAPYC